MSDIPKSSGAYWWREKDGDEWKELYDICRCGGELWASQMLPSNSDEEPAFGPVANFDGQWAKAHRPDEGVEAWAVFKGESPIISTITYLKNEAQYYANAFNKDAVKGKYTCEPVTIYRKDQKA